MTTTLTIELTDWPLNPEPRNGDNLAFLVTGIVRRVEDQLVDISGYPGREYLHGSREVELTVTSLKPQPFPEQYA